MICTSYIRKCSTVFNIWQYLTVFVGIAIPSRNHMETLRSNFEYRHILGNLRIELVSIHSTVKYPRRPSATVDNHMGTHQIPLDTFGNPEYSNYLLFKHFLRWTRSSNKRWRPQTICSRASIVFIWTNPAKIQIYRQLLLPTQIPSNTWVFEGIWVANIKYRISVKYRQILYMGTSLKAIC